jgi:hypothetical protein
LSFKRNGGCMEIFKNSFFRCVRQQKTFDPPLAVIILHNFTKK